MNNTAKGEKKKKDKGNKKGMIYPKDICNYCKEPSHWKKDCPKKTKKEYVATIVQNDSSSENDLVLFVVDQQQQHSEQWIMDLGWSYYMCPHRNWFVTYEKKFAGNVLMGNSAPCKTVEIGSIQIRKHDEIVRTLTNVHHASELKKNLVFVGVIDSKGFTYCAEGGIMQIKGKGKSAVMQETKQVNLYILLSLKGPL